MTYDELKLVFCCLPIINNTEHNIIYYYIQTVKFISDLNIKLIPEQTIVLYLPYKRLSNMKTKEIKKQYM